MSGWHLSSNDGQVILYFTRCALWAAFCTCRNSFSPGEERLLVFFFCNKRHPYLKQMQNTMKFNRGVQVFGLSIPLGSKKFLLSFTFSKKQLFCHFRFGSFLTFSLSFYLFSSLLVSRYNFQQMLTHWYWRECHRTSYLQQHWHKHNKKVSFSKEL